MSVFVAFGFESSGMYELTVIFVVYSWLANASWKGREQHSLVSKTTMLLETNSVARVVQNAAKSAWDVMMFP
jgi:hypothetical protein